MLVCLTLTLFTTAPKEKQKPKLEGHTYGNVHKFTIFIYTSSTVSGKQEITLLSGFVSSNNSHNVLNIHSLKQSQSGCLVSHTHTIHKLQGMTP